MRSASHLRFTNSLKIIYSLTLGAVIAWFLFFYLSYCLGNLGWTGDNLFSVFLVNLPLLFVISAIPLGIFILVFLTKGGGLNYFRSWNARNKLYLSALTILIGYALVVFTPNTSVRPAHFPNYYDFYYTYFGLALIAFGLISLIILKRQHTPDERKTGQKVRVNRKKAVLVFCVIFVVSIMIGGFHLKIHRENELLRQDSQIFREGFPHLVNDQWTDNVGDDSNYVNYKGSLFNSGIEKVYNVTLLVTLKGPDNTSLKRTEYVVGDISGWSYQTFDFNIEYSGEVADISAGYRWNEPIE
jgi:hypothetical protein